jgi:hypothetical protein
MSLPWANAQVAGHDQDFEPHRCEQRIRHSEGRSGATSRTVAPRRDDGGRQEGGRG